MTSALIGAQTSIEMLHITFDVFGSALTTSPRHAAWLDWQTCIQKHFDRGLIGIDTKALVGPHKPDIEWLSLAS